MKTMKTRIFTIEEANQLIPELRDILNEINKYKEVTNLLEYEINLIDLEESLQIGTDNTTRIQGKKAALDQKVNKINSLVNRIHENGCFLKDLDKGLIDFLGEKDGRPIFLCWKRDEDQIAYYHELDTGFTGRKSIWTD